MPAIDGIQADRALAHISIFTTAGESKLKSVVKGPAISRSMFPEPANGSKTFSMTNRRVEKQPQGRKLLIRPPGNPLPEFHTPPSETRGLTGTGLPKVD